MLEVKLQPRYGGQKLSFKKRKIIETDLFTNDVK